MKDIKTMTRQDFKKLPYAKWDEEIICDSLIILPSRSLHDSGYRCLSFVVVKDGKPLCLISGGSDVIHIEGIGGFGDRWLEKYNECPDLVPPTEWGVDCLAKSGLLRLFCRGKIKCGLALSSFEIFQVKEEK